MELQLQFGYGMMEHSRNLIESWGGGTVILSPRDLKPQQLQNLADDIFSIQGGRILLDPQFYLPYADHERLTSHDFWPSGYSTDGFWSGAEVRGLLTRLINLNYSLHCEYIILPSLYSETIDDDWIARQQMIIDEAAALTELPILLTVALGSDAIRSDDQIDKIHAASSKWGINGVYLVCEHPNGDYLVQDPAWLTNVMDLVAGLRLKGKRVVVGYSNHQMLVLASCGANAIASGTWMNVRSFPPEKFRIQYDDEIKQRAIWYYCPQTLSEYKVPFLDIALKQGVLAEMKADAALGSQHADLLFAGVQPAAVKWTEQSAFRHYLQCLHSQVTSASHATFDETADACDRTLDAAELLLGRLRGLGVKGQLRDFAECIDVNRAALSVTRSTRGPLLRRKWGAII